MRIPDTAIMGHLKWTRTGTVWATWRLDGLPKGLGGSELNDVRRKIHRALAQGLIGEYMLMGFGGIVSPEEVANKMLAGVDVSENPVWAEEVLLSMDEFDMRPNGRREYWISVPLRVRSLKDKARMVYGWMEHSVRETVALPLRAPSAEEITSAMRAAARIEEAIPASFVPRRSTPAEQLWIGTHAMTRGLYENPAPAPRADELPRGATKVLIDEHLQHTTTPKSYPLPHLDEGGQTDSKGKISRINPLANRFLKVTDTRTGAASYQVLMALAGSPRGGWDEDLDWVGALDELGVNADWVFRVQSLRARDAKRRNARAEINLTDQMDQQEGTAAITGSGGDLDVTARDLSEWHQALGASEREVEIQATFIVAVAGDTADEATERAQFTKKYFADNLEFQFDIPIGGQEKLWWAMWPGHPSERIVKEFAELTTGTQFASLAPMTSTDLGDGTGLLFADNITSGTEPPVLLDLWGQITGDVSGSIGIAGEPGGGKSVAMKIILGAVHDRGGRFIVIDRTDAKEYGVFAESIDPSQATIVDLVAPEWSLDPLRIFGAKAGASQMLTLCSALLGVKARSAAGVMLADVLNERKAENAGLTNANALLARLTELGRTDETARELAGLMNLYADTEYGAVLFDNDLPPLNLASRGIVFLTHGVALPTKEEIDNAAMFDQLGLDKLFGHAMYALLTRIAREICFRDPNELAVFAADELAHVTASPQGLAEINRFLRDGRKHGAPVLVASQDARDFGDEITRSLIKNRILTRQTDPLAAESNLEWFQKGFSKIPANVQTVTEGLSPLGADNKVPVGRRGEALFRDARGRMGKIRTRVSRRPDRATATLSTPKTVKPSPEQVNS